MTVLPFPDTFPELSLESPVNVLMLFNKFVCQFKQLVHNKKPPIRGEILMPYRQRWHQIRLHLSGEDVTVFEFTCDVVVTNEPLKFVLVYTIGCPITCLLYTSDAADE